MTSKIIFPILCLAIVFFAPSGIAFSQSQGDPDTVLFQKYMDSIQNFSVLAKIQVLKRFIELHPESRYVTQVKDMLAEYYRMVDPQALQEMDHPTVTISPPSPPDKSPMPPGVPAAETIEALPRSQTTPPNTVDAPLPTIEPEKNDRNYQSDYTEAFNQGYEKGKSENSRFGGGVAVGLWAGIAGTILTEVLLVLIIASAAS